MVTEKDCIGAIEGYPPHIVELMLNEQEAQNNPRNVAVFQRNARANYWEGGFHFKTSIQGVRFWSAIHNGRKFDIISPEEVSRMSTVTKTTINMEEPVQADAPIESKSEESNEIIPGTEVIVTIHGNNKSTTKRKRYLTTINTSVGPLHVCVSEYIWESLTEGEYNRSGISSHSDFNIIEPEPEVVKVKLTLKDISEGKGVGVPPELIEIIE